MANHMQNDGKTVVGRQSTVAEDDGYEVNLNLENNLTQNLAMINASLENSEAKEGARNAAETIFEKGTSNSTKRKMQTNNFEEQSENDTSVMNRDNNNQNFDNMS